MTAREVPERVAARVLRRRAAFRESVAKLADRAQGAELVRMLLLPGAFALILGFVFMFFGWYGAARSERQIEQIPYLISGGLIGLGLVVVGGLLVASAMWMSMLQRYAEEADERADRRVEATEDRLREELGPQASRPRSPRPTARPRSPRRG